MGGKESKKIPLRPECLDERAGQKDRRVAGSPAEQVGGDKIRPVRQNDEIRKTP